MYAIPLLQGFLQGFFKIDSFSSRERGIPEELRVGNFKHLHRKCFPPGSASSISFLIPLLDPFVQHCVQARLPQIAKDSFCKHVAFLEPCVANCTAGPGLFRAFVPP
jgi:hypothetical protein